MRPALAAPFLISCLAGCGDTGGARSVTGPHPLTLTTPVPSPTPVTIYTATLSASSACARQLPAELAVRVYEARLFADGRLQWSAPTIAEGPYQGSSWKMVGDSVSLVIGIGSVDQGDNFFGIWEDLGGGHELTIDGRGSGSVKRAVMSGTFEGDFSSWYEHSGGPGTNCHATDHHFTLTPR